MSSAPSVLAQKAAQAMQRAVAFETDGQYSDALTHYTDASKMLHASLKFDAKTMLPDQIARLTAYVQRVDSQIEALKAFVPQSPVASPVIESGGGRPNQTPPVDAKKKKEEEKVEGLADGFDDDDSGGYDISDALDGLSVPKAPPPKKKPAPPPPPPAKKKVSPPPQPPSGGSGGKKTSPVAPDLPAPSASFKASVTSATPATGGGSSGPSGFAPRVSDLVLHAIDVGTKLVQQKRLKEAIDVLQHAFDVGSREQHNPSNFSAIRDTITELRQRFVRENRPRMLQDNKITSEELELLRKAGHNEIMFFPIWDDISEGYARENVYFPCKDGVWQDNFVPTISPQQKEVGCILDRPASWNIDDLIPKTPKEKEEKKSEDVLPSAEEDGEKKEEKPQEQQQQPLEEKEEATPRDFVIIRKADPMQIKQTVVGDCSLVCSLIVCASFQQRFPGARIISSAIFPQDSNGKPILNKRGKYCVKMLINGIPRVVTVDDRFPVAKGTKQLLCSYSTDPTELWVSIMEKAFVKVCGGSYDFPGSKSSADLYLLSGWLPDFIAFSDSEFDEKFQWARLSKCHTRGAVLISISTPRDLKQIVQEKLKLVSGHAYAVLEFKEVMGYRLVKIKNPWAKQSWEGLFSLSDEKRCTPDLMANLNFSEEEAKKGVFWMSWEDCIQYFAYCHLSWNPYMLFPTPNGMAAKPTRIACHGDYVHSDGRALLPQFHICVVGAQRATRMHLVLSRHITSIREFSEKKEDEASIPAVAIHLFNTTALPSAARIEQPLPFGGCSISLCKGRRIMQGAELPKEALVHHGIYKTSAHQTLSFDCPPGNTEFTVVIAQLNGEVCSRFTFSVVLHTCLKVAEPLPASSSSGEQPSGTVTMHKLPLFSLPHTTSRKGAWKAGVSCGGKLATQTFVYNPQYRLILEAPARVVARVISTRCKEAIQLHLVMPRPVQSKVELPWMGRLQKLTSETCSLVMQCPMYTHNCAVVDSSLPDCIGFDVDGIVQNSQQGTSKPRRPDGPPPQAASPPVPIVLAVVKTDATIPVKNFPASLLGIIKLSHLLPFVMAERQFVAPGHTKVIFAQKPFEDLEKTSLSAIGVSAEEGGKVIIVPGTDDLQRTQPLQAALLEMFEISKQLVTLWNAPQPQRDQKQLVSLNEVVMQMLLKLDGMNCPTDAVKAARKALVCTANALHSFVDILGLVPPQQDAHPQVPASAPAMGFQANKLLPAGAYTLIASCWENGIPDTFDLQVESTASHSLEEIPQEGAGYNNSVIQGQWVAANNPGPLQPALQPTHSYFQNPTVIVKAERRGIFLCRLLLLGKGHESLATNVSLFFPPPNLKMIGGNGLYTEAGSCLEVEVEGGVEYKLVLSTFEPKVGAQFALRCYCSAPFTATMK